MFDAGDGGFSVGGVHSEEWFYDKSKELKEMVADKGFDLIYNLEYIRDTEAESTEKGGTYYRTIWSCECVAGFLRPQKTQKRGKK